MKLLYDGIQGSCIAHVIIVETLTCSASRDGLLYDVLCCGDLASAINVNVCASFGHNADPSAPEFIQDTYMHGTILKRTRVISNLCCRLKRYNVIPASLTSGNTVYSARVFVFRCSKRSEYLVPPVYSVPDILRCTSKLTAQIHFG